MLAALLGTDSAGLYFLEEIDNGIHPARLSLLIDMLERQTIAKGRGSRWSRLLILLSAGPIQRQDVREHLRRLPPDEDTARRHHSTFSGRIAQRQRNCGILKGLGGFT